MTRGRRLSIARDGGKLNVMHGSALVMTYHATAGDASEPWRANFIHPINAAGGTCITEDLPVDHLHHRGLFWAWRRVMIDGETVGDGWVGRDLIYRAEAPRALATEDSVETLTDIVWISTRGARALPIVRERGRIAAQIDRTGRRALSVEVRLRALVAGVAIAGTDDEKGYSGPSLRLAHSERLKMESGGRKLTPRLGAVDASGGVDFGWHPPPAGFPSRIEARCSVNGQSWPHWVLRAGGMQNCAFPGRAPAGLSTARDLTIHVAVTVAP